MYPEVEHVQLLDTCRTFYMSPGTCRALHVDSVYSVYGINELMSLFRTVAAMKIAE